jgi:hypothetical protein
VRANETDEMKQKKINKNDGKHAVSGIEMTKAESWNNPPTKCPLQSTPSVKHYQAVSSYVYNANKP